MKRSRLIVPEKYIRALEEVLGARLDDEYIHSREGQRFLKAAGRSVAELNRGLTVDREAFLARQYLADRNFHGAYLLYYTTTNFLKPLVPLQEYFLHRELPERLQVLDLGTGTGAASLGLMHYLDIHGYAGELHLDLVDVIPANLEAASQLIKRYAHGMPYITKCATHHRDIADWEFGKEQFDIIIMMNTLNELDPDRDTRLLGRLRDELQSEGTLLIIEPAARDASRRALAFRDKAVEAGYTVYAPCTRQAFCPALTDEDNWCHTEIAWERPSFIKLIDDLTGTLRLSLKYTYTTFNLCSETLPQRLDADGLSRVVSDRFDEKGRTRAILCDVSGRNEYIMNKRDRTSFNRAFEDFQRYDLVKVSQQEPREHDIRVTADSEVGIVLPILGARY